MKYEEGASLNTIYGMKSLGINPANGKEVYQRRNGTITQERLDQSVNKILRYKEVFTHV